MLVSLKLIPPSLLDRVQGKFGTKLSYAKTSSCVQATIARLIGGWFQANPANATPSDVYNDQDVSRTVTSASLPAILKPAVNKKYKLPLSCINETMNDRKCKTANEILAFPIVHYCIVQFKGSFYFPSYIHGCSIVVFYDSVNNSANVSKEFNDI